ncbi:hypothetical protein VH441_00640 [Psychrobacter sp. HD31]|uniref:hypothetical protein n=1 Tax=Psychrobacter sp. HD31 TaxID=3112003 RepID=UPI003DA48443
MAKGRKLNEIYSIDIIDHHQAKKHGYSVFQGSMFALTAGMLTGGVGALLGGLAGYSLTGNVDDVTVFIRFEDDKTALITLKHEALEKLF